ncbi:6-pyruvoyl trahydropterin synthase family protein [Halocatena halophila]|uniref:6-pyruvoyl trahydropterin synthase family protein n=1 Tax=Halocatena halophila TaxID=2814576 RepID=UPI002ED0BD6D
MTADSHTPDQLSSAERTLYIGESTPIRISAGHRLLHHDGKCSQPHGHNYAISVSITGRLSDTGWVVDKGDVTDVIDRWDHKFLLEAGDPLIDAFDQSGDGDAVIVLDDPPTAEIMSVYLESSLKAELPDRITDISVRVRETSQLCATGHH